jgi:predicted dehydrogenase
MDHRHREATYRLVGSRGEAVAAEFVEPHLDDRIVIRTADGARTERMGRRPTYVYQLEEFLAAVHDGMPVPTDTDDAVANMSLIDECYVAAGLQPRQPTTPQEAS